MEVISHLSRKKRRYEEPLTQVTAESHDRDRR